MEGYFRVPGCLHGHGFLRVAGQTTLPRALQPIRCWDYSRRLEQNHVRGPGGATISGGVHACRGLCVQLALGGTVWGSPPRSRVQGLGSALNRPTAQLVSYTHFSNWGAR